MHTPSSRGDAGDTTGDESTSDLLMMAARSMRRSFGEVMAEYDVTPSQARALRVVAELEPVRLSVLAERLRIAPRSATEVVDRLVTRGLVERRPSASDRRATEVVPTAKGLREHGAVERSWGDAARRFLQPLDDDDRRRLAELLDRLTHPGRPTGDGA